MAEVSLKILDDHPRYFYVPPEMNNDILFHKHSVKDYAAHFYHFEKTKWLNGMALCLKKGGPKVQGPFFFFGKMKCFRLKLRTLPKLNVIAQNYSYSFLI